MVPVTDEFRPRDVTVRVSAIAAIPAVIEQLGASKVEVFARARVDLALFDDLENVLPIWSVGRLIREGMAATGCDHFGLLVGQQAEPNPFGLVGLAVKCAPDVDTALRRLGAYLHIYYGGQVILLEEHKDVATLSYAMRSPGLECIDQIEDGGLAILFNFLRALCEPNWLPLEVRFAHRRPTNMRPFIRIFQTSLQFDAERSELVISRNWLRRQLPPVDTELEILLQRQVDTLAARCEKSFVEQVRTVLCTTLLTGQASAEHVAAMFSMHRRTLTRRLQSSGLSYAELVDEGRFEISRRMLEYTALDVKQIAAALDYADASAFTRAFRRWSGTTPIAWRRDQALIERDSVGRP